MCKIMEETRGGRSRKRWVKGGGVAAILAILLGSVPALAHKTFLVSEHEVWDEGSTVEVALTSALEFPNIEYGPASDRIAFTSVVVGNAEVSDVSFEETEIALNLSFEATNEGFAVIAMSSLPRSGEISPEDVSGYFDEIDADQHVRDAFDALPGSPAMMRSYEKHTKIFLCVATCDAGREAASLPVGQALEFVAGSSGPRSFAIVRNGERVANHRVAIYGADGSHANAVADENGEFEVDASFTGAVLLSAIWVTLPEHPDGNYHSDQATLAVTLP